MDAKDLKGHSPTVDDYIVFQNKRYNVSEVYEFEVDSMFAFNTRATKNPELTRMLSRHSGVVLFDEATAVVIDKLIRDVSDPVEFLQEVNEVP
jgi:hypothetical protein